MSSSYLEPITSRVLELLPATASDRYFDYCLEPYQPRRPWRDKYRAENLLWHSLLLGGARDDLSDPLHAIQSSLGRDMTIWGVKWDGARLWWELYFYDPQKEDQNATLTKLSATLRPWLRVLPEIKETIPYMMVSFDLDADTMKRGEIPDVNLYLTGEKAHAGRVYKVRPGSFELENTYRFMSPKQDIDELLPLLKSSVFVEYETRKRLAEVLIPELFACRKVCVAKKRLCDAVYYSGITVDQLLWFFKRFDYPKPLVDFVARHRERFEHLYFDVGIDYRSSEDGSSLVIPKTSYYGTL